MVANQKKYTDEFRRETADYIISTGRPTTECCAELGLNSKTVNKWVQNRRRELAGGRVPKAEDRELREAKRRMRELEMRERPVVDRELGGRRAVVQGTHRFDPTWPRDRIRGLG